MQTTLRDYATFLSALMRGKLLSERGEERMLASQIRTHSAHPFPSLASDTTTAKRRHPSLPTTDYLPCLSRSSAVRRANQPIRLCPVWRTLHSTHRADSRGGCIPSRHPAPHVPSGADPEALPNGTYTPHIAAIAAIEIRLKISSISQHLLLVLLGRSWSNAGFRRSLPLQARQQRRDSLIIDHMAEHLSTRIGYFAWGPRASPDLEQI